MAIDDEPSTQLINAWWADKDPAAGNTLFTRLLSDLRRSAHRNLRRDAGVRWQTTEVVQEAFLKLSAQRLTTWKNRDHFFGVVEILMKRCVFEQLRYLRRQQRDFHREVAFDDALEVPGPRFLEEAAELDAAMDDLRKRDPVKADVFARRAIKGETFAEIAEKLECSPSTVHAAFAVARAWLRVRIADGRDAADARRT